MEMEMVDNCNNNNIAKTYEEKFNDSFASVKEIDFLRNGEILGVTKKNDSLIFNFFNRKIYFSGNGIVDSENLPLTFAIKNTICNYLLKCPEPCSINSNNLVTIREFSGGGPLFSSFTTNTAKIIETTYSENSEKLKKRCVSLGGTILQNNGYDLSVKFKPFDMVPLILNFNEKDEMMKATALYLFQENGDKYLDLEFLMVICTYLTGELIRY